MFYDCVQIIFLNDKTRDNWRRRVSVNLKIVYVLVKFTYANFCHCEIQLENPFLEQFLLFFILIGRQGKERAFQNI